jgi:ferric-dicitrate binding protein FerR (iron transport regulator)
MKRNKIVLINKYLDKSLSLEEERELQRLISSGEIEEDELHELNDIIKITRKIDIPDFQLTEQQFIIYRDSKSRYTSNQIMLRLKPFIKLAAILIVGITIGAIIMYTGFVKNDQFVEIETKRGDKIHLTLPGENDVWLNSRSSIKYAVSFTGTSRVIDLTGEAYFRFVNNENLPLVINCNKTQIICSQASVNIENDTVKNIIEIEVEEGWVAVSSPQFGNRQFIVESGFKGTINEMIPLWIERNNNPNYLAWHTGVMNFENTTMLDVARTLSDVYDVQVDVKGEMKYCFITTKFKNTNLEKVLKEIQDILIINIQQQNNSIIITGNPC